MSRMVRNVIIASVALAVVLLVGIVALLWAPRPAVSPSGASTLTPLPTATPSPSPTPTPSPTFNKAQFSIDDPSSIWVVVDKLRPLNPPSYVAPDLVSVPVAHVYAPQLRKEAADALVTMFAAYTSETGGQMQSQSAYRSYSTQVSTYNGYVKSLGKAGADQGSARPGYSEHQTGLALDISAVPNTCALQACFADTPQGKWLVANAYKYGFIMRYPDGLDAITGYHYEPWHYRYVGVALATEMHTTGIQTLEQFFGLPDAPDYAG